MKNKHYYIRQALLIGFMALFCILFLIPIVFMINSSFTSASEVRREGFSLFPSTWSTENYKMLFKNMNTPVGTWLINSFIVAFSCAILTVVVASLSAFAFARMKFKGRKLLFNALLLTMMIPSVVSLIPNYMTISAIGLKNTLLALIIPCLGGVANVFLIRQFLYSIPKELDEAALMDGANYFKMFYRIILPQMVPILMVVALNTFIGAWNDILWPVIINSDIKERTIATGLETVRSFNELNNGVTMAATLISALPVLIIYLFTQKYLIRGISLTSGMKE